jgi:hypothetical protein
MRSHTGGDMSLGRGVLYGTSKGQKLNTKSSTEAELGGVMMWCHRCYVQYISFGIKDTR